MKYKGIEIGIPTLEQIEECCREEKLRVPAIEVYNYYTKKNWLTGKHKPVMTLEAACASVNGAFLKRLRKNEPFVPTYDGMNNNISKNDLEEFERLMELTKDHLTKNDDGSVSFQVPRIFIIQNGEVIDTYLGLQPSVTLETEDQQLTSAQKHELQGIYEEMIRKIAD